MCGVRHRHRRTSGSSGIKIKTPVPEGVSRGCAREVAKAQEKLRHEEDLL